MIQESLRTGLRCAARAKGVGVVFPETRLVGPPHPAPGTRAPRHPGGTPEIGAAHFLTLLQYPLGPLQRQALIGE